MSIVALPSHVGKCIVPVKVAIERRGSRGGDLPDALGVQPYEDPFRPQNASLSICRTDCSVTKNGQTIAELLSKNLSFTTDWPVLASEVPFAILIVQGLRRRSARDRMIAAAFLFYWFVRLTLSNSFQRFTGRSEE